ncbi:MAG: DUF2344 domain-containing protein [Clostridia bacterium]|nr:DUF2344 domain-containing protein [Clostridia bacterium]
MADIRVYFTKLGRLKYISHLDLQRAIARLLVRSELPIAYSEGFNPHPRLTITQPLSIYQEGERESFDFRLTEEIDSETVKSRLSQNAFSGMEILEVEVIVGKSASKSAIWRLELETDMSAEEFSSAFKGEMQVTKRSKSGEKLVDIAPLISLISAEKTDNGIVARIEAPAAGNNYLNPSYVVAFFGDRVSAKRVVRENIIF